MYVYIYNTIDNKYIFYKYIYIYSKASLGLNIFPFYPISIPSFPIGIREAPSALSTAARKATICGLMVSQR